MIRPRFYSDRYFDIGAEPVSGEAIAYDDGASGAGGPAFVVPSLAPLAGGARETPRPARTRLSTRVELDFVAHEVTVDGAGIALTRLEFALLAFFVKNPHRAFSRRELVAAVWQSPWDGRGRTVDVHVTRLRAKLEDAKRALQTVHGVGYRYRPVLEYAA